MSKTTVLLIGIDPKVVNYDRWPGLTAEKLQAGLQRDVVLLNKSGYEAEICSVDHGQTAEEVVKGKLADSDFGCILIGAGVRTDTGEFFLFEKLINVVHQHAPRARICFNTGHADSLDAVRRWV